MPEGTPEKRKSVAEEQSELEAHITELEKLYHPDMPTDALLALQAELREAKQKLVQMKADQVQ